MKMSSDGNAAFYILISLCTAAHIIRTAYEILKFRKKIIPGKVSFLIIFTDMGLLWATWFGACSVDAHRIAIPAPVRYAGLALAVAGVAMFITALSTIKALESYEGDLISRGIYSKIRHPMYLSFIFWLAGFPVFRGATVSLVFALVFTLNILYWRHLEELELVERFPGYRDYRKTTIF